MIMNSRSSFTLFLFFIGSCCYLFGQGPDIAWDQSLGGGIWEELHDIVPAGPDAYLVGGLTSSATDGDVSGAPNGAEDYWVVKIDLEGNKIWDRRYGGSGLDRIWNMAPVGDNGFILAGTSNSDIGGDKSEDSRGAVDYWVVRIDNEGEIIWDRTYGGAGAEDLAGGVFTTSDNGFIISGYSDSDAGFEKSENSRGESDYWVLKLDSNGDVEWDRTLGGLGEDQSWSLWPGENGFYVGGLSTSGVSGEKTEPSRGSTDFWLLYLDYSGNIIWDRTYGGNNQETLLDITPASSGGFYLAGQSASEDNGEKTQASFGGLDYWLLRIDANGDKLWDQSFGGTGLDVLHFVYEDMDNNVVFGGVSGSDVSGNRTSPSQGGFDYWMLSVDTDGTKLWERSYGGAGDDAFTVIRPALDGGYIIGGHSQSGVSGDKTDDSNGLNDMWLFKTACQGSLELGADTTVCIGTTLSFDGTISTCPECIYEWSDGLTDPARTETPEVTTSYSLFIEQDDNCFFRDTILVEVGTFPEAATFEVIPIACDGTLAEIEILNVQGGTAPFGWSLNNGAFEITDNFDDLNAGDYDLSMIDAAGCTFDTSFSVEAIIFPTVEIGADVEVQFGDTVMVEAAINIDPTSISWSPQNWSSCNNCFSTSVQPTESGLFSVLVTDENGCTAEDELFIKVFNARTVFIPNVFSPNDDGYNDLFRLQPGRGVEEVKLFQIFDRWGHLVFEERDILPEGFGWGWNGKKQGELMGVGTYVYYFQVRFDDGMEEVFSGDVMLLR